MNTSVSVTTSDFLSEVPSTLDPVTNENTTSIDLNITNSSAFPNIRRLTPYDFIEYKIYLSMFGIYPFITTSLGTIGNLLVLVVLSQKKLRSSSSCVYMAALSVTDTVVLWFFLLNMVSRLYVNHISGPWFCRFLNYFTTISTQMSVWLVVSMTVERFIAVYFPFKAGKLCTVKNARIVIMCLLVVFVSLGSHEFFTTYFNEQRRLCRHDTVTYATFLEIYNYVDASLTCLIPEILLFTFNFMIVYKLKQTFAKQKELTNDAGKDKSEQNRQVTIMLLTVSFAFAILLTPFAVFFISSIYWVDPRKPQTYAIAALTNQFCIMLLMVNHSINFLLYFVSGKRFRNELRKLICCWKDPKEAASMYTMNTVTGSVSKSAVSVTEKEKV